MKSRFWSGIDSFWAGLVPANLVFLVSSPASLTTQIHAPTRQVRSCAGRKHVIAQWPVSGGPEHLIERLIKLHGLVTYGFLQRYGV